jgi:hypothetical protein
MKGSEKLSDFLKFFDELVESYPLHLSVSYGKICSWQIRIYRKGCREDGGDLEICNVQEGDMELCFARAQVELKDWLLENNGGY